MKAVRVLLADDHALVRAGFRALLEKFPEITVVGEAANGREALKLIDDHKPDVVLMDVMMPELNGLETTARAAHKFPDMRIVILSMNACQEFVLQALQAGAAGYLLKNITPTELELAVRAVARGETYLSSAISGHVVQACLQRNGSSQSTHDQLSPRQREILQLIAEGNPTKRIAEKMGVSVKTAETHRTLLMNTLEIHDIAGLTRYAIRIGLVAAGD